MGETEGGMVTEKTIIVKCTPLLSVAQRVMQAKENDQSNRNNSSDKL